MAGGHVRIRHGVTYDPTIGMYRAIRQVNGGPIEYLGPWTTEANAQANADEAIRITHEVVDGEGIPKAKGDTPLGIWTPTETS